MKNQSEQKTTYIESEHDARIRCKIQHKKNHAAQKEREKNMVQIRVNTNTFILIRPTDNVEEKIKKFNSQVEKFRKLS